MSTQPENEQPPQETAPSVPASGIGQRLREAREARGLQTSDIAQSLKITQRQIEAMEREDFGLLPGAAFVRGFLRNYARFVGLNLDDEIRALVLQNEDAVPARALYRVPEKVRTKSTGFPMPRPCIPVRAKKAARWGVCFGSFCCWCWLPCPWRPILTGFASTRCPAC